MSSKRRRLAGQQYCRRKVAGHWPTSNAQIEAVSFNVIRSPPLLLGGNSPPFNYAER